MKADELNDEMIPFEPFIYPGSNGLHWPQKRTQIEIKTGYPFGMVMPGRSFSSPAYRYGFQGQEKDDEVNGEGNSIYFKFRIHDPRLGRFLSIDPLADEYPFYSPYSFSGNRLIDAVDLEGLEPVEAPGGGINPVYTQTNVLTLPNATTIPIYQHATNGRYAITFADRRRIAEFRGQGGYDMKTTQFHDDNYLREGNGSAPQVQIMVGVGGLTNDKTTGERAASTDASKTGSTEWNFNNAKITAPGMISTTQQVSSGFSGFRLLRGSVSRPATEAPNSVLINTGNAIANNINNAVNTIVANSPAGATNSNFSVTIRINENFSADQQTLIQQTIRAATNPTVTLDFRASRPSSGSSSPTMVGGANVTATQTTTSTPTLR